MTLSPEERKHMTRYFNQTDESISIDKIKNGLAKTILTYYQKPKNLLTTLIKELSYIY